MGREKEIGSLGPGSWGGHHPELLPPVPQALLGAQPHVQSHISAPADHANEHFFYFFFLFLFFLFLILYYFSLVTSFSISLSPLSLPFQELQSQQLRNLLQLGNPSSYVSSRNHLTNTLVFWWLESLQHPYKRAQKFRVKISHFSSIQ